MGIVIRDTVARQQSGTRPGGPARPPLCGGGNPALAPRIANIPIWAFHGAKDDVIPVTYSRNMIRQIRMQGGNPRYTEYPDVGHDVWLHALKEPGLVDWLFSQHR